ncbi:MAG: gliding motility-associated C-terminal domain-containing protein [Nonlabens sp.]
MKKILQLAFALLFTATAFAQTDPDPADIEYPMGDMNYSQCLGIFTDSQGMAANYLAGESFTTTICSPFTTDRTAVNFTAFDLAPGDVLIIYDGNNASAPFLGAFGSFATPTFIQASNANTSGCLTFVFTSNPVSPTAAGWEANITCIDACQNIESNVVVSPAPEVDGLVRICQGETVTINGTPVFPASVSPIEEIVMPDGSVISGSSVSQTIDDPGVYIYDYVVTDPTTGCRDRTIEDVVVLVSTTPDFTGTEAVSNIVCFGETVEITGTVETQQFAAQIAPPEAGQTFLPDVRGSTYETDIDVEGFLPGQTFNAASDLISVYIIMEHSYMGDLDISLISPNGSEVFMMEYPNGGGATWLGEAIDPPGGPVTNDPGVGYRYNFTEGPTATQTLATVGQALPGAVPCPEGDYLPEGPFSDFIGSEMNGEWTIRVVDNLSADNGYIFEWGLIFNPNVIPPGDRTYEPDPVVEFWQANPDIINTVVNFDPNDNTIVESTVITVQPSVIGQNCYNFEFTDDFGCTYIEEVCVDYQPEIITATPPDIEVCTSLNNTNINLNPPGQFALNGLPVLDYRITYYTSLALAEDGTTGGITNTSAYPITADTEIFIRVENANSGCYSIESFSVDFSDIAANAVNDQSLPDTFPFNGRESFDLTQDQSIILGSQTLNDVQIFYYTTPGAAQAGVPGTEISNPDNFENTSLTQLIYVRVQDMNNTGCFSTTSFQIEVIPVAPVITVTGLTTCDTFPFNLEDTFNLSDNNSVILDGRIAGNFTFTYYLSEANALANTNEIGPSYDAANGETVFALLTNNTTGEAQIYSFELNVEDVPATQAVTGLEECDTFPFDTSADFNLSDNDGLLLDGRQASDYSITYYLSESDALANTGEISSNYEGDDGELIFALLTDNATGCVEVYSFDLNVEDVPATQTVMGLEECDTFPFDLTTDFDLTDNEGLILNGRQASDYSFNYYTSESDALANVGEISSNYEGNDGETVFALLTDNATGCAEVYSFNLTTLDAPPIGVAPDLSECDEAPFDLRLEFDLSLQNDAILGGLSPVDYEVSYYTSQDNAFDDVSEISSLYEAADGEVIYARLTDLDTGCANVSSFNITVEECEVIFPEGFTPNNDGTNDTFEIPNIQQYPNFSLKVFNRYGSKVYETTASNYVEFDGVPNSGLNSGDGLLPVGTYFYVLEFNDGETQDIASWMYINY